MKIAILPAALLIGLINTSVRAALPPPPQQMSPWAMPWGDDVPGEMSADGLIDKPAGKDGPVIARDGHFYSGSKRLRFWGFSIAFSGAFPSHPDADAVAKRLVHFGVNAIRFHHMDNMPFPNGIFADASLEKLSPEALDRLDYFIAALKAQGIYSDLNLHVSRWWSKSHHWPNADKLESFDKMLDLFDPKLIEAQKQYARDLLGHVNPYTHTRYADESGVCFLEINNENTLFLWGGEQKLAELPEPYGAELNKLWNDWLAKKYPSRDALAAAWAVGQQPLSKEPIASYWSDPKSWILEQHDSAKMSLENQRSDPPHVQIRIDSIDSTSWHLQFVHSGIKLRKGQFYSVILSSARADLPRPMGVSVGQAHAPWSNLGLATSCELSQQARGEIRFGFVATADDDDARIALILGQSKASVTLGDVALYEGGREGLDRDEDAAKGNVARGYPDHGFTPARKSDWYDFLQQTDQAYFEQMRQFLRDDLGVKCPITGTIGLGPLGTLSQSKMDFVDAHAYWDHPQFPHRQWDMNDWTEKNQAMVDDPAGATLWSLAATRVAGKPFTVTEYNHAAPNEWQAECIPLIATYAALQDWDGVFLFDYVGSNRFRELDRMKSFFDFEGNPQKMDLMPDGARLFVSGAIEPLKGRRTVSTSRKQMLDTGSQYYWNLWPFERDVLHVDYQSALDHRLAIAFDGRPIDTAADHRVTWTGSGLGSGDGRFILRDPHANVFLGFSKGAMPIDLGDVRIEKMETPFVTIIVTPANPQETIASGHKLLVSAVARGGNEGMKWDADRHTIGSHWGQGPPLIEVVQATLSLRGKFTGVALTPEGKRKSEIPISADGERSTIELGSYSTLWYELDRN